MSCYTRHMGDIFEAVGLDRKNKADRKAVDNALREFVGVPGPCPDVWKAVKPRLADEKKKAQVIAYLKEKVGEA